VLREERRFQEVREAYPHAHIFGCSTSGEIYGTQVSDDSLAVTAIKFEHTKLKTAQVALSDVGNSFQAGERLASSLNGDGLVHVLVLSDGLQVNGSELV